MNACLAMLKYAVTESVSRYIRSSTSLGERCRRPEISCFLVTQVVGLSTRVTNGVIIPGGQAELVRIFAPRIRLPALGNDSTKFGIREDVRPWGRRCPTPPGCHAVLTPILAESPDSVVKQKVRARKVNSLRG